jgi:hypothetical protein
MAGPERVQALLRGANVKVILKHKHTIVELQLQDYGRTERVRAKWGNAQKLSTNLEADDNPAGVWKFKRFRVPATGRDCS